MVNFLVINRIIVYIYLFLYPIYVGYILIILEQLGTNCLLKPGYELSKTARTNRLGYEMTWIRYE